LVPTLSQNSLRAFVRFFGVHERLLPSNSF
jgi:hypothetical protein